MINKIVLYLLALVLILVSIILIPYVDEAIFLMFLY